ncbi:MULTISPECIES: MFS transporter [Agrobacterium]|jgi:UMF1 family MFS transporter|uniref:MFS transporter n=2 Tax=Agrobacterium pusense TaxID=648995 RepID=A0AA44ENQ8_9HYPH|nr:MULTISPECIES: MFS transporter [Agrobacterium]MDP9734385.1 UMF1 family MFS transporter [Rhizobium sp. SORGH_AS_0285]MDR6083570.1 UMF1 family MFS transporter [Agrobacterium sp. SORGH_AS_0440]NRF11511.1 MFS transporter [Agrobacterium pusense]NRF22221.1 MFS transporter [Agrobacterium pusense]PTV72860.1 MFS transporter [Agrobacterium pusense]
MTSPAPNAQAVVTKRGIWGWVMFDWAAQPFFTVVTTFVFGPYFVARLTDDPIAAQATWSNVATVSSIIIALFSPILGSIADQSGARKPWIAFFAVIKIVSLCLLWYAAPGSPVILPVICMILASIAAEFSIVFNDSMMPRLTNPQNVGRISNLAWGLGYLGGMVVLIAVVTLLAANPKTGLTLVGITPLFGLDPASGQDARITGPIAALWYLIFILPMFLLTPDSNKGLPFGAAIHSGLRELKTTLRELRHRPMLLRFLIARMLYQDGVNGVVILGGAFAAGMFGWETIETGLFGILLNVVAIVGCFAAGRVDQTLGSRNTVLISLVLLLLATIGIVSTEKGSTLFGLLQLSTDDNDSFFATAAEKAYLLYGVLIGLAFGPVQASSRSYLARNISVAEAGRYFGIYALSGRATSFMATLSFSIATTLSGSAHIGMATLIVFLGAGFLMLLRVPERTAG